MEMSRMIDALSALNQAQRKLYDLADDVSCVDRCDSDIVSTSLTAASGRLRAAGVLIQAAYEEIALAGRKQAGWKE